MTILNTIVACQLRAFKKEVDALIDKKKLKKDEAVFNVLREYIKSSKRIRFDGDGYSEEWEKEAARRKLSNNNTTPAALEVMLKEHSLSLFSDMGVMSAVEVKARHEVELENYILHTQIDGRVYNELVYSHIIPAAVTYQHKLIRNVLGLMEIYGAAHKKFSEGQLTLIEQIAGHIEDLKKKADAMTSARKRANALSDVTKKAVAYCENVRPYFDEIRYHCDRLERLVDDQVWPLAKYRELLFIR
jgi:glutamine synthetase